MTFYATLRRYQSDDKRTLGILTLPCGWQCYTLELPWRENERSVSCIPQGDYSLTERQSPLITRITGGEYTSGFEITPVQGRQYIMFHHGNWPRNTDGCVLVGREPAKIYGELGVPHSLYTFRELMTRLDRRTMMLRVTWDISA